MSDVVAGECGCPALECLDAGSAGCCFGEAPKIETWVEWGVRRTWGDVGSVAPFERDRRTAEKCAHDWPGVLVSRVVTAQPWAPRT